MLGYHPHMQWKWLGKLQIVFDVTEPGPVDCVQLLLDIVFITEYTGLIFYIKNVDVLYRRGNLTTLVI